MAEGAVTQLKEGVAAPLKGLKSKPIAALVTALVVVSVVVLIEIFYPGAITGRVRKVFNMVGVKGAA